MTTDKEMLAYLIEKRRALMTELKAIEALIDALKSSGAPERQVMTQYERK